MVNSSGRVLFVVGDFTMTYKRWWFNRDYSVNFYDGKFDITLVFKGRQRSNRGVSVKIVPYITILRTLKIGKIRLGYIYIY